jgi:hypothetical protein
MFIIYLIGFVITFILVAFLNVKYKFDDDSQGAIMISILWPVALFVALPLWLFAITVKYSWKKLNEFFSKILGVKQDTASKG